MIPVCDPVFDEEEIAAVVAAMRNGEISGTFGKSIQSFEDAFANFCGSRYAVAVSSGTAALQIAVSAAGIKAGDEVLVSASTNIASALAAYHNQAVPVPVDSELSTWNLDLDLIEGLITEKTKAIIPVHLYGTPVDMPRLMKIAEKHNLTVIEDSCEAHGAKSHGQLVGSFGQMGCFSFYANKLMTTGEGGMIVTNDSQLADRLRLLRNLGFTEPRFVHEVAGHNFRMTGIQAAMGLVQLKRMPDIVAAKRRIAALYTEHLRSVGGIQFPFQPPGAENVYWMYAIVLQPEFGISRDDLCRQLRSQGIDTRTFFCPMNLQPCFKDMPGFRSHACPVAEEIWRSGLYLPSTPTLSETTIAQICQTISQIKEPGRLVT